MMAATISTRATAASSWRALQPNSTGRRPGLLPPFRGIFEGGLQLVGEEQLAGDRLVFGADPDGHRADGVGAADGAAQLGQDAVGAQAGGDDPGVEGVGHGAQVDHGTGRAPPRGGRGHGCEGTASISASLHLRRIVRPLLLGGAGR